MSAPNTSTDANVIIRCGHVIPQIRLTPPDSRPSTSLSVPEQDLGPNMLFVPLRTEEIGWEEGGLVWAPKRFCYPTVNLYGGEDDHVIGEYRGGPEGYRIVKITDPAFSIAQPECTEEAAKTKKAASTNTSKSSKSQLPKQPIVTKSTLATSEPIIDSADDADSTYVPSSSASSSRQGSFSVDEGYSSGANTGVTTPTTSSNEQDGDDYMSEKLNAALSEIEEKGQNETEETPPLTLSQLTNEAGDNSLEHDRTIQLSDSVPSEHFTQHRGRSVSKLSVMDLIAPTDSRQDYAAGWAYEQNMCIMAAVEGKAHKEDDDDR